MSQTTAQTELVERTNPVTGPLTDEEIEKVRAELPETDGEPLETCWHRAAISLLVDVVVWHLRGRTDFFVGGNMFLYYSRTQARNREYNGPDFLFVKDVDGARPRQFWWVFDEGGRFPNLIMELLSPTTAEADRTTKKDLYEQIFRTPEYFYFDPETAELSGWRLVDGRYKRRLPNDRGWLWSEELGLWVGTWDGTYQNITGTWVRFYNTDGNLAATEAEAQREHVAEEKRRAEELRQRVDVEKLRADQLAAELARVQALLKEKQTSTDQAK